MSPYDLRDLLIITLMWAHDHISMKKINMFAFSVAFSAFSGNKQLIF